jgi:hypothetical protein
MKQNLHSSHHSLSVKKARQQITTSPIFKISNPAKGWEQAASFSTYLYMPLSKTVVWKKGALLNLAPGLEISKIGQELNRVFCVQSLQIRKIIKNQNKIKNLNFIKFHQIFTISSPAESWQQSAYFWSH